MVRGTSTCSTIFLSRCTISIVSQRFSPSFDVLWFELLGLSFFSPVCAKKLTLIVDFSPFDRSFRAKKASKRRPARPWRAKTAILARKRKKKTRRGNLLFRPQQLGHLSLFSRFLFSKNVFKRSKKKSRGEIPLAFHGFASIFFNDSCVITILRPFRSEKKKVLFLVGRDSQ